MIAPALAKIIQATGGGGVDYSTFVIVGTVGLLIPLTCIFAGIGVIVDRASGARRELLTAPIPRALIVLGNMAVAIGVSLLQVGALMAAGWLRGSHLATPDRSTGPCPRRRRLPAGRDVVVRVPRRVRRHPLVAIRGRAEHCADSIRRFVEHPRLISVLTPLVGGTITGHGSSSSRRWPISPLGWDITKI